MYLAMLELNPRSRQVQSELRDPYQMHRTLSKAFGEDKQSYREARCLFRVDEPKQFDNPIVLIQSRTRPDLSRLSVDDRYLASEPRVKEFKPSFRVGQRLKFRLRANPTVKRDGKRIGLASEEDQRTWFQRKAEKGGFCVLALNVYRGRQQKAAANGSAAEFTTVVFEGVLEVADPEKFSEAIENGVGSGKGFGYGLLSVAPVR